MLFGVNEVPIPVHILKIVTKNSHKKQSQKTPKIPKK